LEIYLPLAVGGRVEVMGREEAADGALLGARLKTSGATVLQATPATWRLLLEAGWEGDPSLRALCGGEALPRELAEALLPRVGELWNVYGPTETAIWSAAGRVAPEGGPVPLGAPLANTRFSIIGRHHEPVPIGVPGELWIAGNGVARGYLDRPDLTAEKFIPDPFAAERGVRLYRTGDLVRWRPSGELEFLGRLDHQVKIRGFRIELGEIEAALLRHESVRAAVVVAREDGGDRRLVAYLVAAGEGLSVALLRQHLRHLLPDYMVPTVYVVMESLPLTSSGKVDRKSLPAPAAQPRAFTAPRTPTEEVLAGIWISVLKAEVVGAEDSFFELGGHSLLATQLASRVREAFGVELPLRRIFEAPTLAALARAIETARAADAEAPPLVRTARGGDLPLSFAQQRLWFLSRLDPDSAAYNLSAALRLAGRLDVAALAATLDEIVRRHEVLRTTFAEGGREPVAIIHPPQPVRLPVADLAGLHGTERQAEARQLALEDLRRPFDLDRGPLLRTLLVRMDGEEFLLLFSMHHIVSDGWSMGVLVRELTALYEAFATGKPANLPELPIQYVDFACWQRAWLSGRILEEQLGYWKQRLADAPALLELAADRPRPAVQRFRGGRQRIALNLDVLQRLQVVGRKRGATLFMALLAAFSALVRRYTGQEDMVIGSPIAGRQRVETENLIGLFLNTLALRTDLPGDSSFQELLDRARGVALEAYAHQDLPFEKLVDELELPRDLSHAPLFQVLLVLQNVPMGRIDLPGLVLLPPLDGVEASTAKFDLSVSFSETSEGLAGVWKYNADLFDPSTVARMCGHFGELLETMAADPERRLSAVPLLSDPERQQLLEWNATEAAYPCERCLHEWIEAQAARTPGAVALVYEGDTLTYAELDARAERLARTLRNLGVGTEVRVGICVERSLEMMVGLLGILKAGGAYVPLDPSYPQERLAFMLEDSQQGLGSPVLVTQRWLLEKSPAHSEIVVCLDDPLPEGGREDHQEAARPEHLAYVIYTSGSTGRPKGAMNSHRAIVNRLLWMQEAFGLTPDDRVIQKTPFSFDVSVWELFWPLMFGARLVIARPEGHKDAGYLARLIAEQGVTTVHFVPSMLQAFLEAPGLARCSSLKRVIASGEALPSDLERRFFDRLGWTGAGLYNLYGPTEAAVDVTFWACERESRRSSVPIGRPIANTRIHLLDRHWTPVPIGVPGELHIGGTQVGRGYLNRPELTAAKFVPDFLGGAPGARLYATGDLARYLPEGAIEFLGRLDLQVKIRGFRIELGEIESALLVHPDVREAVVVARQGAAGGGAGDWRLVAYAVPEKGRGIKPQELRAFLTGSLPEYMLPTGWVVLDAMPLTPSGKVDRRALPPETAPFGSRGDRVSPRNELERFLASLWKDLLGVESVGIRDDFFALGGNSISGAVLINRLQERLGEIVHVVVLFDAPTVEKMAAYLVREHADAVARLFGPDALGGASLRSGAEVPAGRISAAEVARFRNLIVSPRPTLAEKNPPAIFVLSPPRSGSTLLRVMLGGHPKLFAPPELELLGFSTLAERRAAFPGRDSFWLEGAIRAVMEIHGCGPEEAKALMEELEEHGLTTAEFYGRMQSWLGGRILVDKTPSYALDLEVLRRAEEVCSEPFYIHLIRHPYGMIRSFEEAKLDQIFFRREHSFSRRELAELIWLTSQENIVEFLQEIPANRQHRVRFEELLREPEAVLRGICDCLGLDYHPAMAEPYQQSPARMTDGPHAESRMLGDVKFHQHAGIDREVAERWRELAAEDFLGNVTWQMAERLGYSRGPFPSPKASEVPPLVRVGRQGMLPLSFAQQRLWFLNRLDPDSAAYNISAALRLQGQLEIAALAATLGEIIRRHEVLRTTFADDGREPVQVIHPPQPAGLRVVDLAALREPDREALAMRLAMDDLRQPFDLERGPLLRATLLRLGEHEHLLLFSMHHIVSDGWSLGVLVREVGSLYRASVLGQGARLPELPIQYADYAVWQRSWLRGEVLAEQVAYWRERLAGAPTLLRLPTDRPRPAVQRFQGKRVDAWLPRELQAAFRTVGQRQGATLFMALLAAFAVLLRRHTGEDDVVVGMPTANRDRSELEGLIGFFVNTLPLRVALSGNPSFEDLLSRARETAVGAYAHQGLPFEKLVDELQPERSLSHSPLFQVMLVLQNVPAMALELPALTLRAEDRPQEISKFDLTLTINETSAGLLCQWRYNSELFDPSTVERMAERMRILLEGASAEPASRILEIPLLASVERRQLLDDWSRGETVEPGSRCLHEMVEAQAKRRPEAPAVIFEGGELSYADLNRRANRLARRLRRLGMGPEVPVGIFAERSPEAIVALVAVLKAGGAYVPLDPAYPRERLAWLLADSGAPVVLTQERLRGDLPLHAAQVVLLDEEPAESARNLRSVSGAESLAYIIYTSGSTGRPKGVLVSHRGLDNLAPAQVRLFEVGPDSRVLQFASLSFDASVSEIAMAFHAGAALCLAPRRDLLPGPELIELLRRQRITTLTLPPSVLAALPTADLPDLRTIVVAGEACPVELARFWAAGRRLINAYGPTEATVCATAGVYEGGDRLPVGRPIQNVETYILDLEGQLSPTGVPGELLVGGVGLARGYRGRPDLTAERFVPHPFSRIPGDRLYRTGDLVRFLPDGNLEFLGRIDHQIKLRGVRVEPGEVEAALLAQPGVREAVAVAREDGLGPVRLVAYVVPAEKAVLDPASLRSALAGSLPEPLVPAVVVVLDVLPLTPSGKVDRRALPAPDGTRIGTQEHVAPRTELERFLAGLWQEVLGIERVGVHDDFFALGGNSISGAMLVNRLQRELGEIVHVVVMFDAPTVAQLAAWVVDNYSEAVVRLFGPEALGEDRRQVWTARVDAARVTAFRALIPPLPPLAGPVEKNPPAVFVLSPPRSGSTLLRVMLGGNPRLFAPPELELLSFDTLAERRAAFSGRNSFWLEGVTRAVMEVRGCGAEEAEALLAEIEREEGTTRALYGRLQAWSDERMLVDKTPSYALDLAVLRRAEEVFAGARYIHLLRHPYGMIRSFEEAKLEQVFFRHPHSLSRRELAELIWLVSQQNILEFLAEVPPERQTQVRFEDLVAEPEAVLRGLSSFLGVEYHPDMAEPYKEKSARMTDGIHAWSRMLGDVKFHQHAGIDRAVAERWRELAAEDFLGDVTWEMAERLGYPRERPQAWAPIVPAIVEPGQTWPLSFAQERLWVLDRMDPGSPAYNILSAVRLIGRLEVDALARSLTEIVRRHAVLRSVFTQTDSEPAQIVAAPAPVPLPRVDLEGLPAAVREREARRLAREFGRLPFDLERGPMLRVALLRFGSEEHAALFATHHVASDGWSMGVLIREVSALYAAFREDRPSPLPELPIQYLDYARWQREWLTGDVLEGELAYWREALAGVEPLQLPTDRPRPPFQTFRGAARSFTVSGAAVAGLRTLGQRQGGTPFMVLLAAFSSLLHRYSGQEDISIGSPTANRTRHQLEDLIGFFVNTLVLRADLSGAPSFERLLARVRRSALAAFAHQELPFEKVVFELQPQRDLSSSPLFQVMLTLQNTPAEALILPGLELRLFPTEMGTAKFDLTLSMVERPDGLAGGLEYNTDLFDGSTVDRMLSHFQSLLEQVAADPQASVADLPLLSQAERHQLAIEWSDTSAAYPRQAPLYERIARQAARSPDLIAVTFGDERLTYGELEAEANRLARYLIRHGVRRGSLVGLCMERSLALPVALLGILKAGAAYVPMDPSYPEERLVYMLEDAGLSLLLADLGAPEGLCRRAAGLMPVVLLEEVEAEIGREAGSDPLVAGDAADLAYVLYTSGSTGRPKGVEIPHGALVNFLESMREQPGLEGDDALLAVTSLSFDIAGLELYLPLLAGARVDLASRETAGDGARLLARLRHSRTTVLQATPSTWRMLLEAGWSGDPELRVLCGGEALPERLASELRARSAAVWNLYGPTETTIWSAVARVGDGGVLIGRPIANTRIEVLDSRLAPVPAGVLGELCIGGEGLARGYRNRPDLTAERFVPNPWAAFDSAGSRLYRTGDLARYRTDGALEFLGRLDRQVKVRGFRIELGEIEAALEKYPEVAHAVALAREDRLIAFLVPRGAARPAPAELRARAAQTLPDYMVPGSLAWLEELPLTPNGKVDRRALARFEIAGEPGSRETAEPRTLIEELLAEIWCEVLSRERIGIHDDFFALGGHSLKATQLTARVRQACGVDLPLRRLFEAPTVAGLAQAVERLRKESGAGEVPPLVPVSRDGEIPLSFSQQRVWVLDQLEVAGTAYHLRTAVRLRGNLDACALGWAINEVVRRHEALRTTFANSKGRPLQVILPRLDVPLPRVDLRGLPADLRVGEARRVVGRLARLRFDLSRGPLLRTALVVLGEADHLLGLTVHHIAADGWSLDILVREVAALYQARLEGSPSPLPPLPIQYADFAVWQRSWLQGESLEAQLSYWRRQLADLPSVLQLAVDRPRRPGRTAPAGRRRARLSEDLTEALRKLGRSEQATPFMTLLAGFATLLHSYTGQRDLAIGTPIANRRRVELEGLIGFFANTLVLRADLEGDPGFKDLLARIRSMALDAYAHQDLPFERLVEELQPERDLGMNPLFQVMFQLQNVPATAVDLPGLSLSPAAGERGAAMFDLVLAVRESAQGFSAAFDYDADLFEAVTIERFAGHWVNRLAGAAADPGRPLSALPLLGAAERHQVSTEWADSAASSAEVCVHELIQRQVERTPEATAVSFQGRRVTYRELDSHSGRLAARLTALGLTPEARAGVCMDRTPEMVVALLAVWKAGAAYVPMDPSYPTERLAYMLADAGITLLLADEATPPALLPRVATVVRIDRDTSEEGSPLPAMSSDPAHLAYVIYTSGSTGKPKGVEITHRALVNFLRSMAERPGLGPDDVLLAVTSLSFDIAALELFLPLLVGARLELASREIVAEGSRLLRLLGESAATIMQATPVTWHQLVEAGWRGGDGLKVLCGGEALPEHLAVELSARSDSVWNLYGPTETTVWSAARRVRCDDKVAVGPPIANTGLFVLDAGQRPVPVGVPGELWIGGLGLARGYRNRPELTAERFVPDPLSGLSGARIYRTGDLARFRSDGAIEFLGRVDHQVKVRGFRIELGEIETELEAHPAVERAVVTVCGEESARRLAAYLVPRGGDASALSVRELRESMVRRLPDYMVPSAWVLLDALPLTPNGKVDRSALPAPEGGRLDLGPVYVAPRTALEEVLAGIWSEVLRVERVGIQDNFFALGGHSLLATQVVSRIGEVLEIEVPLRRLFEAPTVLGLAETLLRDSSSREDLERAAGLVLDLLRLSEEELDTLLLRHAGGGTG
jgi:amino acid adenylation domain-containing protein